MDKDIDIWKQRNEILHKKVDRQMSEIKELNKKSETIFDLARRFPNKTYRELEKYRDADRVEEAMGIGHNQPPKEKEIDYHRYWKDMYEKEHKLRQEAETETILVKGIGMNSPEMKTLKSEVEALKQQLHTDREKYKRENNDLFLRIAELTEVEESHRKMNGKLQERLTEVEEDNKKLANQVEDRINQMRRSGM